MTAVLAPGVEVDRATSTITLAGQRWPAVGVLCPGPHPEDPEDRVLGGRWAHPTHGCGWELDVYVPAESGVLVNITWEAHRLDLTVQHTWCEVEHDDGLAYHLPQWLHVHQGALHPYPRSGRMHGRAYAWRRAHWHGCEPEWAAEHLARLLAMPAHPAPGPTCELVPLSQCPWSA